MRRVWRGGWLVLWAGVAFGGKADARQAAAAALSGEGVRGGAPPPEGVGPAGARSGLWADAARRGAARAGRPRGPQLPRSCPICAPHRALNAPAARRGGPGAVARGGGASQRRHGRGRGRAAHAARGRRPPARPRAPRRCRRSMRPRGPPPRAWRPMRSPCGARTRSSKCSSSASTTVVSGRRPVSQSSWKTSKPTQSSSCGAGRGVRAQRGRGGGGGGGGGGRGGARARRQPRAASRAGAGAARRVRRPARARTFWRTAARDSAR
jgi:hypothetical protein